MGVTFLDSCLRRGGECQQVRKITLINSSIAGVIRGLYVRHIIKLSPVTNVGK